MGNQSGRSMIEMLGVLAIIGILSAGGIAGYSKVMMKYKINKWIEEVSFLIQDFVYYEKEWKHIAIENGGQSIGVTQYVTTLGNIPATWKQQRNNSLIDSLSNTVVLSAYPDKIFYNVNIKTDTRNFDEICQRYWTGIIIPQQEEIYFVHHYGITGADRTNHQTYYGNQYCTPKRVCIKNLKISDIVEKCTKIIDSNSMIFSIYFK